MTASGHPITPDIQAKPRKEYQGIDCFHKYIYISHVLHIISAEVNLRWSPHARFLHILIVRWTSSTSMSVASLGSSTTIAAITIIGFSAALGSGQRTHSPEPQKQ
ncbi:hypothetical protein BDV27DRAFT_5969 [Aspergillus caelatus]|uniref:Uncharacterized protein n=1 Tax=Aspergillus caelatus TaxID=61420 RepID=A0A5N7ALD3_9EURO|nr:uncharacterized protein BDV27DRAFT_5969 [Aspergillus caelatus]KAE8369520.1 hypothetical protein BDV27DRAFT_5969 [Aspergillus caelatus]